MKKLLFVLVTFLLTLTVYPQIESEYFLEGGKITAIKGEQDYVWVATDGFGIFRYSYKDAKWTNYSTQNRNLENDMFYNIAVSPNFVWAGSVEGLFIFDRKKDQWRKRKFAIGGEFGNWIRSLYYDKSENVLWIGRFRNLTKYDIAKNRFTDIDLTVKGNPQSNTFISICSDGDSVLYFSSEAGIHKYNKKIPITEPGATLFIDNKSNNAFNGDGEAVSVSDMLFDRDNIWFATEEFLSTKRPNFLLGGLYKYDRSFKWERLDKEDGLPANGIYCMSKVGNSIWAGVYSFDKRNEKEFGRGLVIINRFTNEITPVDLNETALNTSTVRALFFDGKYMWIGSDKGLLMMKVENPIARWEGKKETKSQQTKQTKKNKK